MKRRRSGRATSISLVKRGGGLGGEESRFLDEAKLGGASLLMGIRRISSV